MIIIMFFYILIYLLLSFFMKSPKLDSLFWILLD